MNKNLQHEGHRVRLREKFLAEEPALLPDEDLLELLLTYAIPRKNVQSLAKILLAEFGSLGNVLAADLADLCQIEGIKQNSAILLKLAAAIQSRNYVTAPITGQQPKQTPATEVLQTGEQPVLAPLFKFTSPAKLASALKGHRKPVARYGSELFGKAVLKEAIEMLPKLPDSENIDDIRAFLRKNLHFSAEETRKRYAAYITRRMFPDGVADAPLRQFAREFPATTELRDVCYYRFCKAEPLMPDVISNVFLPVLGLGRMRRERITHYLQQKFPESKNVSDCVQSIVDALVAGGIASTDRKQITFSVRPIRIASFAYILQSEFPEPGMYEISKAESNRLFASLLWTPEQILAALYELRNLGIISKISEIDSFRQFTTKFELPEVVRRLVRDAKPS